ncbi:MAG TPA: RNA methyltransferase [bacterium]|nr:RNA methyltransferase [bacterium]
MPTLSRKNPRVTAAKLLARDARMRAEQRRFLVDGPKLVREALDAAVEIDEVFVSPVLASREGAAGLAEALTRAGVPLLETDDDMLAEMSGVQVSQGIVAVARIPDRVGPDTLVEGEGDLLLAATVQDPGNAGALVRIAAAAGFAGVVADLGTADFYSPKAVRGSAGAVLREPAMRVEDLAAFAGRVAWKGGVVIGAVARGGDKPAKVPLGERAAIIVGSEGQGLPQQILDACTARVTIPMAGNVESLNVAAAAAILCFEVRRRREG